MFWKQLISKVNFISRLQPLLARIKESRNSVVVPIIDVIHDKTFEYQNNGGSYDFELGGFTWSGHFTWIPISTEEERRRGNPYSPTRLLIFILKSVIFWFTILSLIEFIISYTFYFFGVCFINNFSKK